MLLLAGSKCGYILCASTLLPCPVPLGPPRRLMNACLSFNSNLRLNTDQTAAVWHISRLRLLVCKIYNHRKKKNNSSKLRAVLSFQSALGHVFSSAAVFAGQSRLFVSPSHVFRESFHRRLFMSSFVFLFVCSLAPLCSWANKAPFCPGHWYGPIKGCDQPERFNDGCDAGVDRVAVREGDVSCCVVVSAACRCFGSAAQLQTSTADKMKLTFPIFCQREGEEQLPEHHHCCSSKQG